MILISGASGFIGGRLFRALSSEGIHCRTLSRKPAAGENAFVASLSDKVALADACAGVNCVFHCAGYAHAFASLSSVNDVLHWKVNFEGTCNIVEAAAKAGVQHFVFLSSVKAMAEPGTICADEEFSGEPKTAYGQSKRAAEQQVLAIGKQCGMHVVNLRLAMVYGAGGRGNLERMANLIKCGWFPPLPETGNHRSLIHVDDVVAVMRLVAKDVRAYGRTYIIASSESPSGRGLYDALRLTLGMPRCKWAVPAPLLRGAAIGGDVLENITKKKLLLDSDVLNRLLDSAWYSSDQIERELGWRAEVSLFDGLVELIGK